MVLRVLMPLVTIHEGFGSVRLRAHGEVVLLTMCSTYMHADKVRGASCARKQPSPK